MLKNNIKYFLKFAVIILIYLPINFCVMHMIQWWLMSGQRSIIVEIGYYVMDLICTAVLFWIGYRNSKIEYCLLLTIFSLLVLFCALLIKDIYPAFLPFFGFSMITGTIIKIIKNRTR